MRLALRLGGFVLALSIALASIGSHAQTPPAVRPGILRVVVASGGTIIVDGIRRGDFSVTLEVDPRVTHTVKAVGAMPFFRRVNVAPGGYLFVVQHEDGFVTQTVFP